MADIPLSVLLGVLFFLIILSAFFSGSETGLMTLNRYRLRHLARGGNAGARRAQKLLERPDRLIGLILLGNNFVNILASALATVIALRLLGEAGIMVATALLTVVILLFAEVTPKTLAALRPERIAFPAAFVYGPLLRLFYPLVWVINVIANSILRLFGVSPEQAGDTALSSEELRTVVLEAGAMIPKRHQKMLLNLLDLEKITVEDIMVPRNEIDGVDLTESLEEIEDFLSHTQYTRLPVYEESIDHVVGILHMRNVTPLLRAGELSHESIRRIARDPYFIPEGTPLNRQLLNFQREGRRTGLVVDEYGDILGLATLEDILEEIVGEFTTDPYSLYKDITPQDDGSFLVDATAAVRELNRALKMELPTSGPKTLNGLILEHMEDIPEPGTSLLLADYPVEIVQTKDNAVKTVRVFPKLRKPQARH
ncbi:Mg2+ and Co2+ transporter CorB [Thiohalobacter thiocyanaticus]|uniref:Mg2+ and Co2+ transporter CorB n=1 Tax=Thiohalobacter thiocyanaticus TaxID=585455 RepID=A0A1Z4VTN5_9GAMM|nr:HlyC/CorC family transporter [Thiohalobacter thiocyanaticus]BAZ94845.1 Mg2+ and Co2+ transporter CorB [Thiohalobacter thiocyanaticus]